MPAPRLALILAAVIAAAGLTLGLAHLAGGGLAGFAPLVLPLTLVAALALRRVWRRSGR